MVWKLLFGIHRKVQEQISAILFGKKNHLFVQKDVKAKLTKHLPRENGCGGLTYMCAMVIVSVSALIPYRKYPL